MAGFFPLERLSSLHPTRWARNSNETFLFRRTREKSPSHTVGSERYSVGCWTGKGKDVSIPHGGLGTTATLNKATPEHTSPSHTVGSERRLKVGRSTLYRVSIPHGGLGTAICTSSCLLLYCVSIPHGGLGTVLRMSRTIF